MWFRVDDRFYLHPKARQAGHAALGAWVLLGSAAADIGEDGYVPGSLARGLASRPQLRRLVDVGLLERADAGYRLHDWADIHRPRTEAERSARYRKREKHATPAVTKSEKTGTDTRHPTPEGNKTTDDDRSTTGRTSSSSIDRTLDIAARALGEEQGNTRSRYLAGIRRNLQTERGPEIAALCATLDPVTAAGKLVGSPVAARNAARAIEHTAARDTRAGEDTR